MKTNGGRRKKTKNRVLLLTLSIAALAPATIAQTSRSRLAADPNGQYFIIKRAFTKMVNKGTITFDLESRPYNLEDCSSGSDYLSDEHVENDPMKALADLAYDIVRLRTSLARIGYPESAWGTLLTRFEKEELRFRLHEIATKHVDDFSKRDYNRRDIAFERIKRTLTIYRRRAAMHLPRVIYSVDCGGEGETIKIRTDPPNGRALFISVFKYNVCKENNLNPDDPSRCDWWHEAVDGELPDVAGDYFYVVTWPDGVRRTGKVSFIDLKEDTITFRKP